MLFQAVLVHIGITLVSLPACEDEFGSFPGVTLGSTLGPLWDNFGVLSDHFQITFYSPLGRFGIALKSIWFTFGIGGILWLTLRSFWHLFGVTLVI